MYIVLSGPQAALKKVQSLLSTIGYAAVSHPITGDIVHDDWGFSTPKENHQFLTVEGEDPEVAMNAVAELKWDLRAYFDTPEPQRAPSVEEKLAAIGLTRAELKTLIGN